ncbi:MAG: aldehyde dehydrogenase family protein [Myxococcota bacterium]
MVASTEDPGDGINREAIDAALETLDAHKQRWATLNLDEKIALLDSVRVNTLNCSARWVQLALRAKGIPHDHPVSGEEWLSGPYQLIETVNALSDTLKALRDGQDLLDGVETRTRPDGQLIAQVFPRHTFDKVMLNGVRAEVWMQPGVTASNLRTSMAQFYRSPERVGRVTLVLGAGNIASIPPLDMLYKLFVEGQVVVLKMNPVNAYLGEFFEAIFDRFVQAGFVRFLYGGAAVGRVLTEHPLVEAMHITGSEKTHDVILFGPGEEGVRRKASDEPVNTRPMTSELGGVGPTIVVPGPWSDEDLAFQAEHVATQKMHNGGFNCIASQVLILPTSWGLSQAFLSEVERVLRTVVRRSPYYPGAAQRTAAIQEAYPDCTALDRSEVPRLLIRNVDADNKDEVAFNTEFFSAALAQTTLPGSDAETFLRNAVAFANETLHGTLGANIIIHPDTLRELGAVFEEIVAELEYGAIGVNAWSGTAFAMTHGTWGAFPGHPRNDIQSGVGVVHNALMFGKPQKTVVYAPFAPFPRSMFNGERTLMPKPPWFITNKTGHRIARLMTQFSAAPGWHWMPTLFRFALRG